MQTCAAAAHRFAPRGATARNSTFLSTGFVDDAKKAQKAEEADREEAQHEEEAEDERDAEEKAQNTGAVEEDSGGNSDGPETIEWVSPLGKPIQLCGKDLECCITSCKTNPEMNKDDAEGGVDSPKAAEQAMSTDGGGDEESMAKCTEFCQSKLGRWCFPGDSTVLVHGRGPVPLAALQIGDEVLALRWCQEVPSWRCDSSSSSQDVTPLGWKLCFETVVSFLHFDPAVEAEVLCIQHTMGKIQLTENHLIFVQADPTACHRKAVPTLARDVSVGDRLLAPWVDGSLAAPEVLAVLRVRKIGMFAPLLETGGALFVDGTAASCFAIPSNIANSAMYHGIARTAGASNLQEIMNGLFVPLRMLYQLPSLPGLAHRKQLRADAESAQSKEVEGHQAIGALAPPKQSFRGVHPYADLLYHFFSAIMR